MSRTSRCLVSAFWPLSFLRRGLQSRPRRAAHQRLPRCRLGLDELESRIVPAGSSVPVGLGASLLRDYYGVDHINFGSTPGTGANETIAIVNAFDDPNIFADLDTFDQQMGLASYGSASSILTVYNGLGVPLTPQQVATPGPSNATTGVPWEGPIGPGGGIPAFGISNQAEMSCDVEWAHAMAPAAKIDLVECFAFNDVSLYFGATTAAGLPNVSVVSMSFGDTESDLASDGLSESGFDAEFVHSGVTFVASTGDQGAPGEYAAYSPNVLAVGGTQFNNVTSGAVSNEVGWTNAFGSTGGGISQFEQEPAYQDAVQSTGFRTTPDVAFDAGTPVAVSDSYDNASSTPWDGFGFIGTSIAAPSWSGIIAVANQGLALNGVAPLNSTGPQEAMHDLYQLGAQANNPDFNDITSGSNGGFSAHVGYDEVTGLGTPVANIMVPDLVSLHPHYVVTTNSDFPSPGAPGQSPVSLRDALSFASQDALGGLSPTITFASTLDGETIQIYPGEPAFGVFGYQHDDDHRCR